MDKKKICILKSRKKFANAELWAALIVAILATLVVQRPRISDPYAIEDDFRNMYWMHLYDDPDLFQAPDPFMDNWIYKWSIRGQTLIVFTGSPAYSLFFQLVNLLVPFLLFSKFLIFPLTLVSV